MDAYETLTELGLNQYETKAYLAIVRRDSATPAEVADLAGIPRQRAYDVLRSLAEHGLVATVPSNQLRYAAIAPDPAISELVDRRRQQQSALEQRSAALRSELAEIWSRGRHHEAPLRYIEVLRDRDAVAARTSRLLDEVRDEFLALVRPPYFAVPEADDDLANAHLVRSIYERSALDDAPMRDFLARSAAAGEQARIADSLPLKMVIADRRLVVIHLPDPVADENQYTMLLVDHPELAGAMAAVFETVWTTAEPLDTSVDTASR